MKSVFLYCAHPATHSVYYYKCECQSVSLALAPSDMLGFCLGSAFYCQQDAHHDDGDAGDIVNVESLAEDKVASDRY